MATTGRLLCHQRAMNTTRRLLCSQRVVNTMGRLQCYQRVVRSPLQSYTIFEKVGPLLLDGFTPCRRFLPRFRTGLMTKKHAREAVPDDQQHRIFEDKVGMEDGSAGSWAKTSAATDKQTKKVME